MIPGDENIDVPYSERSNLGYVLTILIQVLFWAAILLFAAHSCRGQAICPPHVAEFVRTVKKPVVNNQVVCRLATCDQDRGQSVTLAIIKGDPKKLFKTGAEGLLVNNAAAINRSTTRLYTITIRAKDNGTNPGPLTNTSVIKLTVTR